MNRLDTPLPLNIQAIGIIETPYNSLKECPKNTRFANTSAFLHLDEAYYQGLLDLEKASHLLVLYWLDKAERNTLRIITPFDQVKRGVFATRSPNRPNPIGFAVVKLLDIKHYVIKTSALDCLNGTPLIDIKPYVRDNDSHPEASLEWLDKNKTDKME